MFTLNIQLTAAGLEEAKADLRRELPSLKSADRCEAMARGLGFRTYAALLGAIGSAGQVSADASGAAFRDYLAQRGEDVAVAPFYRGLARTAIRAVLETMPKLTRDGIGIGDWRRNSDGTRETPGEYHARFAASRAELLDNGPAEEFLLSLAFVALVERCRTVRPGIGSYGLKHIAENYACTYPEGDPLGPRYVANGSLIAAAVHAGFKYKTFVDDYGRDHLNVIFNMTQASIVDADCMIRPDGARAQDRRRRLEERRRPFAHTYA